MTIGRQGSTRSGPRGLRARSCCSCPEPTEGLVGHGLNRTSLVDVQVRTLSALRHSLSEPPSVCQWVLQSVERKRGTRERTNFAIYPMQHQLSVSVPTVF